MSYEAEFEQAAARTRTWGLMQKMDIRTSGRYVSSKTIEQVSSCAQKVLGHMTPQRIAAQCFAVSSFLREPLEAVLGLPLTYTLGYVNLGRGAVFHTPVDDLKAMIDANRPTSGAVALHA